jgi:AcrR family transcriptional regulator
VTTSVRPRGRNGRPRPRWHRRKDARPGELVDAALEVFAEKGYAATRLADVARRAGVTKGTIYLYFENKEALFKAVVRQTIIPNIAQAERDAAAFAGSAAELLRDMITGWWRVIGETKLSAIPKLVMSEAANFPTLARFYQHEVVARSHRLIADIVRRGIDRGEFLPVNVMAVTRLAMAPLVLAVLNQHSVYSCVREARETFDAQSYLATHIDILLRGLSSTTTPRA